MTKSEYDKDVNAVRFDHEIRHGQYLSQSGAEAKWGWGTPAGRERLSRRAKMIIEAAALSKELHVLEVGCGTGIFTEQFAATRCNLTAVDLSPDLLSQARARMQGQDNVRFELKPFEECIDIGPFDAIIGSSVLHHLNMTQALFNIFTMLKPGGRLAFAEPNILNPQIFIERKCRRFFPYVSPDETAFYRWKVARDLEAAGFRDVKIVPFDWLHPATPAALILSVSALGRLFEHLPGLREFSGSLLMSARKSENIKKRSN